MIHGFLKKAYLALADKPKSADGLDESGMTEAEKKKARSKARKAELKAANEAAKKGIWPAGSSVIRFLHCY